MTQTHSAASMRNALQFLLSSDIPSDHKAVLIEALTFAMRDHDARQLELTTALDATGPWQPEETARLEAFLTGKVARSWQHADEILTHLASQLHRNPHYVRSKATELGFGESIDYRLAKVRAGRAES
jgi:hypothetical protein